MGDSTGDEDQQMLLLELDHPPKSRKGGHITIPIILVNDSCERVASMGVAPNMVFYLMNEYHLEAASASIILSVWLALSTGLAIVGAFLADSCFGRFRVIALGSISSLCGTMLLWLTAMIPQLRPPTCEKFSNGCNPPEVTQLFVLFCSFVLISIGAGCIRPCSIAFGIDQVDKKQNSNSQRAVERYINWYNSFIALGMVFTLTVILYIQDNTSWKVSFVVSAILMAFSAPVFLLASSLYVKVKAGKSLIYGFFQVIVAAMKNKSVSLPPINHSSEDCYYQGDQTTVLIPTDNLRCLNKACIIKNPERDLNPDGSCSDPWSLCTVEQVEALKTVLRVIPIWSASIVFQASASPGAYATLQAKTMYRKITPSFEIPAASGGVVCIASFFLFACIYEGVMIPLLVRCTGKNRGISPKTRMSMGIICLVISMAISAVVEAARRNVAIKQGAEEDVQASLDISFMWLIPQYVLNGVGGFLFDNGLTEYLYTQFSKKMGSIAMALYIISSSGGNLFSSLLVDIVDSVTGGGGEISWLASNINKGHLDYYYWLLGVLSLINLVYFYLCWWWSGTSRDGMTSGNLSRHI